MVQIADELLNEFIRWDKSYDEEQDIQADAIRNTFLQKYPKKHLQNLEIDEYIMGKQGDTFCYNVEIKTKELANIQGTPAIKFGIYYNSKRGDYEFPQRFGSNAKEAFQAVKREVVNLIDLGNKKRLDFSAIDKNPLTPMFKAKLLSLYSADRFIAVCSPSHLLTFCGRYIPEIAKSASEYQHNLLKFKNNQEIIKSWSSHKFMKFLYSLELTPQTKTDEEHKTKRKTPNKDIDFQEINRLRDLLGKRAEDFAYEKEMVRLKNCGLEHLAISDKRKTPSAGYDFGSYNSDKSPRQIEVKSVGKDYNNGGYRFFLSKNEKEKSKEYGKSYYFYLVYFNQNKLPYKMDIVTSKEVHDMDSSTVTYQINLPTA